MIKMIEKLYSNYPRLKQVTSLFAVNMVVIPVSIVSNIFITRFLGAEAFGDFKFMLYVFSLAMVIFTFGFFQAGNRAIVLSSDLIKTRELYGSMILVLAVLFAIMSSALVIYSLVDNNISDKGLKNVMLLVIPFTWIFLLMNYFEVLFQADNRISLLAKSRLYPKLFFFAVTLFFYIVFAGYKGNRLLAIWIMFISTHMAGFLYILYRVNPLFSNSKERLREILHFNKTYGFNVYIGTLFNVAMSSLTGMLISYFGVNNAGVGYFSLAMTIADPLNFIPNVIATTHYKEFASKTNIGRRLTLVTIAISVSALFLCWILVGPFVNIFYGPEFKPVIFLTIIGSIGIIFHGIGDFYNRFMGSHGRGKALRNSAIIVGIILFICNFTLVPMFGETGAAVTRVIAGISYLLSMLWYYRRLVRELKSEKQSMISSDK